MGITLARDQKPQGRQSHNKALPLEGNINVSVRLEPIENASVYYVNCMEIVNTPLDFTLICGRIPGKLPPSKIEELRTFRTIYVEPDVQIVMPTTLIPALIRALTERKNIYEETYGIQLNEVGVPHE